MAPYIAKITGKDKSAMADLVAKHKVSVLRETLKKADEKDNYIVDALIVSEQIPILEANGYKVEVRSDVREAGKARQLDVSKKNRYISKGPMQYSIANAESTLPMNYLNVDEVESALQVIEAKYSGLIQRIQLPNKTWENRSCHCIKISNGNGQDRIGIYLTGGIHAREWVPPDALINFAEKLTESYEKNTDIILGDNKFNAAQIKDIINKLDIIVFPQVNPDGRNFSMGNDSCWRKNRRPHDEGEGCIGVDVNRNFDFLWNFPEFFDPNAPIANSISTCGQCNSDGYQTYIGPSAASEPETKNVIWVFDNFPNISYYVDVHSYGQKVLYDWGDDVDQTTDKDMNFRNPTYYGKIGMGRDTKYKEYIDSEDRNTRINLAKRMKDAIDMASGNSYSVEQSFSLYPTAGTSTDYACSRSILDPSRTKVHAFTIECGEDTFQPEPEQRSKIIQEVTAAILAFCLEITKLT